MKDDNIRRVYVARCQVIGADEYDLCVSYDRSECVAAIESDKAHTTKKDRKMEWYLAAYDVPSFAESAKENYENFLDNSLCPDAVEVENF